MNNIPSKKRYLNDLILVGAIALIVAIAFAVFALTMREGKSVTVSVDGKIKHTYSLSDEVDKTIEVEGGSNHLVIKGGKAYIESATCPDKICANHRPISKDGETIVCLPNRVVVAVSGD